MIEISEPRGKGQVSRPVTLNAVACLWSLYMRQNAESRHEISFKFDPRGQTSLHAPMAKADEVTTEPSFRQEV